MSENQTAQMNLREPDRTDWDNYNTGGSSYSAPPPALGPDGKPIVYRGTVGEAKETTPDEELLNYLLDPIRITDAAYAGKEIRFTRASVKPFKRNGEPMKGNPSKLGNFLRSAGLQAKPQTNSEWRAAVAAAKSKPISFTIDWEAYNKDTGESVKGYLSFPEDPERPGQRKSILKKGDMIIERDAKGNVTGTRTVESEVLFANARLRYFVDATPRVAK